MWRRATDSPQRTCIGCRRVASVSELVRFFRMPAPGSVPGADPVPRLEVGAGSGRGAWLCAARPVECLDQAIKRRSVARALRCEVSSDDLASLRARLVGWNQRSREFEKPEVEK